MSIEEAKDKIAKQNGFPSGWNIQNIFKFKDYRQIDIMINQAMELYHSTQPNL